MTAALTASAAGAAGTTTTTAPHKPKKAVHSKAATKPMPAHHKVTHRRPRHKVTHKK